MAEDSARDGLNWYTYANNNPVMYIDPSGLAPYIPVGGARPPDEESYNPFSDIGNFFKGVGNKIINYLNPYGAESLSEFFDPEQGKVSYSIDGGSDDISLYGEYTYGYSEGINRLNATQSILEPDEYGRLMVGYNPKLSIVNAMGMISSDVNESLTVSLKGVGDLFSAQGYAGAGIDQGAIGFGGGGIAAVASGRGTVQFDYKGWETEIGVTGFAAGIGKSFIYGYDAKNGFKLRKGGSRLFGAEFLFRVKPPDGFVNQLLESLIG